MAPTQLDTLSTQGIDLCKKDETTQTTAGIALRMKDMHAYGQSMLIQPAGHHSVSQVRANSIGHAQSVCEFNVSLPYKTIAHLAKALHRKC